MAHSRAALGNEYVLEGLRPGDPLAGGGPCSTTGALEGGGDPAEAPAAGRHSGVQSPWQVWDAREG